MKKMGINLSLVSNYARISFELGNLVLLNSYSVLNKKKALFMKSVELEYSKSRVDKAGNNLKDINAQATTLQPNLEVLSNWRAYHARPLDTFARVLKNRVKKVSTSTNSIVAQRLKRTSSILLKLKTHRTMRLSAMQDIGGLRAIFDSLPEVLELLEVYRASKSKHTLFSIDNYIDKPKADGYRGIHLVYKLRKEPSIFIEIQIRSHLQHIWATGVEVIGTLQNSSFKSGYGDEQWLEFFTLLSSVFALKESSPVVNIHKSMTQKTLLNKTKRMIRDLKVIEQLNAYTSLYKRELKETSKGRKGNYSLILLDSEINTISIETFSVDQIDEATESYIRLEQEFFDDFHRNVVLVNSGDIKKLEIGYPNYFMDTNILATNLALIAMDKYLS